MVTKNRQKGTGPCLAYADGEQKKLASKAEARTHRSRNPLQRMTICYLEEYMIVLTLYV